MKDPNDYEKGVSYKWNLVPVWNRSKKIKMLNHKSVVNRFEKKHQ